jgi:hypothetical protein
MGSSASRPLEVLAGKAWNDGHKDGALETARLNGTRAVCMWGPGGHLFVADYASHTIRCVHYRGADRAEHLIAPIAAAVSVLPKELTAIIADYAHVPFGVRTIAGTPDKSGAVDGHALRAATFNQPTSLAIDDSDPIPETTEFAL